MRFLATLVLLCLPFFDGSIAIAETVREQEIAECRSGEVATWNDGADRPAIHSSLRIHYRHQDAPAWFARGEVESLVVRAAKGWAECGIPTEVFLAQPVDSAWPGTVQVLWDEAGSRGNFGLANLSSRTLSLGPKAFALLRSRNPQYDARQTLQMVLSHEMGHFFGLIAHSRRCVDVLSYYHDASGAKCFTRDSAGIGSVVEYRHVLPTACDIERCRAVNRLSPLKKKDLPR